MIKVKKRNPLAFHLLMKKGGLHRKSRGGERQSLKQATRQLVAQARESD
jgi:hypothetical protein